MQGYDLPKLHALSGVALMLASGTALIAPPYAALVLVNATLAVIAIADVRRCRNVAGMNSALGH